jgi:hypothetical protein
MAKISLLKRVSAVALAAMLLSIVGCANRGAVPMAFSQQPSASQQRLSNEASRTRGGAFTAKYTGTLSVHFLWCGGRLFRAQLYDFRGVGRAAFTGLDHVKGSIEVCGPVVLAGATLFGPIRTNNGITADMHLIRGSHFPGKYYWRVHGGAGTFARAAGHGTVIFHFQGRSFTADWTGGLHY